MNAFNANFGQDEGVARRGAPPRANMERGDWHRSDEESDDDVPDMANPAIAASSDEELDEDGEESGYMTEESEAESAVNIQEEESDDEAVWRELDEAMQMMENEGAEEASSDRNSPDEYAPWDQNRIYEPPARLWEPARPSTPFRMVDAGSEASETAGMAVADEGAADGVASPPPFEPEGIDWEAERAAAECTQWMSWWRQQILQQQKLRGSAG
ncbi:uncharacterized protein Dwil_GK28301, partial [Drosophila willistoni]